MENEEIFPFELDFSSSYSCSLCKEKDKEILELKTKSNAKNSDFKALKEKIIVTDKLLRQFRAKSDALEKQIEEWVRKYEKCQREVTILDTQLRKALHDLEPQKEVNVALDLQIDQLKTAKDMLIQQMTAKLETSEFLERQCHSRISELEAISNNKDGAKSETHKKMAEVEMRLRQQKIKVQKLQLTNKALKIDLTKSSRLKNRMVKQLKSVESKLSIYLGTMVEHESVDDADDDGGFLSDADSLKDVALSESFKGSLPLTSHHPAHVAISDDEDDGSECFVAVGNELSSCQLSSVDLPVSMNNVYERNSQEIPDSTLSDEEVTPTPTPFAPGTSSQLLVMRSFAPTAVISSGLREVHSADLTPTVSVYGQESLPSYPKCSLAQAGVGMRDGWKNAVELVNELWSDFPCLHSPLPLSPVQQIVRTKCEKRVMSGVSSHFNHVNFSAHYSLSPHSTGGGRQDFLSGSLSTFGHDSMTVHPFIEKKTLCSELTNIALPKSSCHETGECLDMPNLERISNENACPDLRPQTTKIDFNPVGFDGLRSHGEVNTDRTFMDAVTVCTTSDKTVNCVCSCVSDLCSVSDNAIEVDETVSRALQFADNRNVCAAVDVQGCNRLPLLPFTSCVSTPIVSRTTTTSFLACEGQQCTTHTATLSHPQPLSTESALHGGPDVNLNTFSDMLAVTHVSNKNPVSVPVCAHSRKRPVTVQAIDPSVYLLDQAYTDSPAYLSTNLECTSSTSRDSSLPVLHHQTHGKEIFFSISEDTGSVCLVSSVGSSSHRSGALAEQASLQSGNCMESMECIMEHADVIVNADCALPAVNDTVMSLSGVGKKSDDCTHLPEIKSCVEDVKMVNDWIAYSMPHSKYDEANNDAVGNAFSSFLHCTNYAAGEHTTVQHRSNFEANVYLDAQRNAGLDKECILRTGQLPTSCETVQEPIASSGVHISYSSDSVCALGGSASRSLIDETTESTSSMYTSNETTESPSSMYTSNETTESTSSMYTSNETTESTSSMYTSNETTESTSSMCTSNETTESTSSMYTSNETTESTSSMYTSNETTESTSSMYTSNAYLGCSSAGKSVNVFSSPLNVDSFLTSGNNCMGDVAMSMSNISLTLSRCHASPPAVEVAGTICSKMSNQLNSQVHSSKTAVKSSRIFSSHLLQGLRSKDCVTCYQSNIGDDCGHDIFPLPVNGTPDCFELLIQNSTAYSIPVSGMQSHCGGIVVDPVGCNVRHLKANLPLITTWNAHANGENRSVHSSAGHSVTSCCMGCDMPSTYSELLTAVKDSVSFTVVSTEGSSMAGHVLDTLLDQKLDTQELPFSHPLSIIVSSPVIKAREAVAVLSEAGVCGCECVSVSNNCRSQKRVTSSLSTCYNGSNRYMLKSEVRFSDLHPISSVADNVCSTGDTQELSNVISICEKFCLPRLLSPLPVSTVKCLKLGNAAPASETLFVGTQPNRQGRRRKKKHRRMKEEMAEKSASSLADRCDVNGSEFVSRHGGKVFNDQTGGGYVNRKPALRVSDQKSQCGMGRQGVQVVNSQLYKAEARFLNPVEKAKFEMRQRHEALKGHTIFSVNGTHSSASWENCAGFVQATEPLIKTSAVCTSVTQCGQKRTGNSLMKQPIFKRAKIDLKFNNDHNVVERTGSSRKECSESGLDKQVEDIVMCYHENRSMTVDVSLTCLTRIAPLDHCWLKVIGSILMMLKKNTLDLIGDIMEVYGCDSAQKNSRDNITTRRVFVHPTEERFLYLLQGMIQASASCDMNQLLRVLWDAILSPVGNGSGNDDDGNMLIENKLASLCRLYAAACASCGMMEQVRALAFHLTKAGGPYLIGAFLSIIAVWPAPFCRSHHSAGIGVIVVIEHLVMSAISMNLKMIKCFERLCNWKKPSSSTEQVLGLHIASLRHHSFQFVARRGASFVPTETSKSGALSVNELCRSIELICVTSGIGWTCSNFIETLVRGELMKWSSSGSPDSPSGYISSLCRIVGRLVSHGWMSKANIVSELIDLTDAVLKNNNCHVEVQAACVEMLLKLAPLKVDAAFNVLKAWSASASRTGECCVLCEKIDSLNSFISDCSERKTSVT